MDPRFVPVKSGISTSSPYALSLGLGVLEVSNGVSYDFTRRQTLNPPQLNFGPVTKTKIGSQSTLYECCDRCRDLVGLTVLGGCKVLHRYPAVVINILTCTSVHM